MSDIIEKLREYAQYAETRSEKDMFEATIDEISRLREELASAKQAAAAYEAWKFPEDIQVLTVENERLREENARLLEDIGHYKKVIDNLSRDWLYWKDRCERFIEENARLLAANKDLQLHFDVVKEDLKKTNEENERLHEENTLLRELLKPFEEAAGKLDDEPVGIGRLVVVTLKDCRAIRAAIREGGKV